MPNKVVYVYCLISETCSKFASLACLHKLVQHFVTCMLNVESIHCGGPFLDLFGVVGLPYLSYNQHYCQNPC